ncbi:hypothetical protein ONE63_010533 [Megalurothrips usitatus]|uniref:Uncharacterized protein n=1 Tax=Megalurothrips usitatus TaxID=439358 RepID=A0AAV7XF69_9NEOP|nr:hypothetical protein ONE63_010533 [Megalurothrips usitatus]
MGYIRILIYCNNALWERLLVSSDIVRVIDREDKKRKEFCDGDFETGAFEIVSHQDVVLSQSEGDQISREKKIKFVMVSDSLEFSYFFYVLQCSREYRNHVIDHWCTKTRNYIPSSKSSTLSVTLTDALQQVIDHKWCHRITHLVWERSELDNAMSWLSTLGGAYSALGDQFTHCAQMAGRISLRQFQIAMRQGDPSTVARCKLYIALSFIQTSKFRPAKQIIRSQYHLAVNSSCPDIRLIRMCRGVWSKLRYEHSRWIKKSANGISS